MSHSQAITTLTGRLADRINEREQSKHAVKMLAQIERLESQAIAFEKVRAARNPVDTTAAHSRKVAMAATRLRAESEKIRDKINEIMTNGMREVEQEIATQAGMIEGEYSGEIRAAFRGMTEKERADTLLSALREGNSEIIAAIGLAPAILSGVKPEEQQRTVEAIRKMKAPALIQESEDISEAFETAQAVFQVADTMFNDNYNYAEQAAIDRAERETAEAEAALTQSIETAAQSS